LRKDAEHSKIQLRLLVQVGAFIGEGSDLLEISEYSSRAHSGEAKDHSDLLNCIFIGNDRNFDSDPLYGFNVLSEIASRALSPGINDPGTAIQIIGSLVRMIHVVRGSYDNYEKNRSESSPDRPLVIQKIGAQDLFKQAFRAISRDGASNIEVIGFLQRNLRELSAIKQFTPSAEYTSDDIVDRASRAMVATNDLVEMNLQKLKKR
ncbi:MAG: DUF2254 domain-containing protein, partial [Proteobacteria bacterium]